MKYEWKKREKALYLPNETPQIVTVPKQKFLMIKGQGNPNSPSFSEKIEVLYALSYAIKMLPKQGYMPNGYFEYTVYPLEGVWAQLKGEQAENEMHKEELLYRLMMRQPEFVTEEIAQIAFENVRKKKPHLDLKEVFFKEMEDGLAVQLLHIGDYDNEPISFEKMKSFIEINNLQRIGGDHREIYLSDARRVIRSKLKTVLRYQVARKR